MGCRMMYKVLCLHSGMCCRHLGITMNHRLGHQVIQLRIEDLVWYLRTDHPADVVDSTAFETDMVYG